MWEAEAEGHTSCGADSIRSWSVVNGQIEPKSPSSNETFGKMLNVKIVSAQYKLRVAELLWCMLRIVWVINMTCTQNPQSQSLHTGPSGQNKTTEPFCYTLLSGCRHLAGWRHTALDKLRCEWLVQQKRCFLLGQTGLGCRRVRTSQLWKGKREKYRLSEPQLTQNNPVFRVTAEALPQSHRPDRDPGPAKKLHQYR